MSRNVSASRAARKVSTAARFRKQLMDAVGEASLDFSGYCRLAAQAMLQRAMEIEVEAFVGRARYQRRSDDESTYRNGYKRRRVATGEGAVERLVPQTRDGTEPFQTAILDAYRRRSETLDAMIPTRFVKGLSVRDVSDTFKQVFEDEGISPATASRERAGLHDSAVRGRLLASRSRGSSGRRRCEAHVGRPQGVAPPELDDLRH